MQQETIASRYEAMSTDREVYLNRAREAAKLTIPSLMPEDGHSGSSKLATPFQSLGARGVNNLASKLLLALLPPNAPFFRLKPSPSELVSIGDDKEKTTAIEKALGKIERTVMDEIETSAMRVGIHEALKQLIVVGNVLLFLPKEGGLRVFRLDRFVVSRDAMGNVLEIIVKEDLAEAALPEEVRAAFTEEDREKASKAGGPRNYELFTQVIRDEDGWALTQECKGAVIESSKGTRYALDKSPWVPLRWTRIDGEDYGRSYCDEYLGDLKSLEGLSKSMIEGTAAAVRVVALVDPNGVTDEEDLANAENMEFVSGREQDISFLQLARFMDFSVPHNMIGELSQRLAFAFLLNTAIQRGGERVTAEEIRYMAGELEDALGGVYSILTQEMQLPLVKRLMHVMTSANKLPKLPKGSVTPTITTGLEALGRGHDLNKLDSFIAGLGQTIGPEALMGALNVADFIQRRATALGIDTEGLILTPEEQQQRQQAAMMQQMLAQLGPNAINQMGGIVQKGMENGSEDQSAS